MYIYTIPLINPSCVHVHNIPNNLPSSSLKLASTLATILLILASDDDKVAIAFSCSKIT